MFVWTWMMGALAAETHWIEVPFTPPDTVPLMLKAEVMSVKGQARGDDCLAAVTDALDQAAQAGEIVRVCVSENDTTAASKLICKKRRAGDEVSASVVAVHAVVVVPGAPTTVYPDITPDRAVQIADVLASIDEEAGTLPIDDIGGKAWLRMPMVEVDERVDASRYSPEDRALLAYNRVVREQLERWTTYLEAIPEVEGAVVEVALERQDPYQKRRSRERELFRFTVPTQPATRFTRLEIDTDAFLASVRVEWAKDPRHREFAPINLQGAEAPLLASPDDEPKVDPEPVPQADPSVPLSDEDLAELPEDDSR